MNFNNYRTTVVTLATRLPFAFGWLVGDAEWAMGIVRGAHGGEWGDFFYRSGAMTQGATGRLMAAYFTWRGTPEGPARDNPIRGPERVQRRASPAPLPWRGPAAGTMSPVLGRPPRAPRSHPVKPGAQAPGVGKGTTASGKPTRAPRATGPDEAPRTTRGHEARQRGTPPATTKAHGQVPSNNGGQVPQTRRARTTRTKPRHRNRCQATPAAVRTDECAPGGYPAPTGYEQPPSGWTSGRPEGTQPLQATNSRRLDGRVSAPQ